MNERSRETTETTTKQFEKNMRKASMKNMASSNNVMGKQYVKNEVVKF